EAVADDVRCDFMPGADLQQEFESVIHLNRINQPIKSLLCGVHKSHLRPQTVARADAARPPLLFDFEPALVCEILKNYINHISARDRAIKIYEKYRSWFLILC